MSALSLSLFATVPSSVRNRCCTCLLSIAQSLENIHLAQDVALPRLDEANEWCLVAFTHDHCKCQTVDMMAWADLISGGGRGGGLCKCQTVDMMGWADLIPGGGGTVNDKQWTWWLELIWYLTVNDKQWTWWLELIAKQVEGQGIQTNSTVSCCQTFSPNSERKTVKPTEYCGEGEVPTDRAKMPVWKKSRKNKKCNIYDYICALPISRLIHMYRWVWAVSLPSSFSQSEHHK